MSSIRVELRGRLGNQLFQYFAAKNHALLFDKKLELDFRLIDSPAESSIRVFNFDDFDGFDGPPSYLLESEIFSAASLGYELEICRRAELRYIKGYFQTYKYYDYVRESYPNCIPTIPNLSNFYHTLREEMTSENTISLHIRRGDYSDYKETFGLIGFEYYREAVETAIQNHGDRTVYIFGDDAATCQSYSTKFRSIGVRSKSVIPPAGVQDVESMLLMGHSSINVIGNSSFAWWAAKFNPNPLEVYAPTIWFKNWHMSHNELIPPDWKRIESKWEL
jgi:hypothetical protein